MTETIFISMPLADLKALISETVTDAVKKTTQVKDPFGDYPELLTRKQVAEMLDIKSLATIDNWAKQGRLTRHRNGHIVRYKKSEVIKAFESLQKFQRA